MTVWPTSYLVDFLEEVVMSLQIENRDVERAQAGDHVGLTTALSKMQARKGIRVYRARRAA